MYARTRDAFLPAKWTAISIVLGSLMHAAGHAFLAGAGGILARDLGAGGPVRAGSISPLTLAIAGLFAAAAKMVGGIVAAHGEARVAGEVGARLRLEVLDGIHSRQRLRTPGHGDHGSAQAALTTHVVDVERGVAQGVLAEARALVQLVPLAVLLAVLAPKLATSAALAMAAFGVFAYAVRRAFKRAHARAVENAGRLTGAADEAVRHAELWTTYGAERRIRAHVAALGDAIARETASLRARSALLSGTSEVLGALSLVLVLGLVARGAVGGVDRGAIVPFAVVFFMAYRPLRELVDARIVRARGEAACRAAAAIGASTDDDHEDTIDACAEGTWPLADLLLDGFAGAHGTHAPISARVPPGRIVAIVGPSGIGKTQLFRAMLGLDAPRTGRLCYATKWLCDATNPSADATIGPGGRPFAWVPQEAPILAATFDDNVALGRAGVDVAPIAAAVGAGALREAVGERALVAERAVSGGERQRIAVARALATELPVLLLDEPTSALDADSERALLDAIAALRGTRTVILVTHRPAPLAIADVVLRLSADVDESQHGPGRDLDAVAAE